MPFFNIAYNALEIGCGGGAFTKKLVKGFGHVTAVDVITMPEQFEKYGESKFLYIEQSDQCYNLKEVINQYDFAFSYNLFCHLSNNAIKKYVDSVCKALKPGGSFIFMLSNAKYHDTIGCQLGECLPMGHFYQDDRTVDIIVGEGWEIISRSMIPEHRDIIVHLKKL